MWVIMSGHVIVLFSYTTVERMIATVSVPLSPKTCLMRSKVNNRKQFEQRKRNLACETARVQIFAHIRVFGCCGVFCHQQIVQRNKKALGGNLGERIVERQSDKNHNKQSAQLPIVTTELSHSSYYSETKSRHRLHK